jgi:hypothetical protein
MVMSIKDFSKMATISKESLCQPMENNTLVSLEMVFDMGLEQ